ncbi:MAG: group 1 truncated hemoglobin [Rivularia sp. ALOHA_DT_140]|nr:group 1 truncated hemoglobin [Rivularia sp. ALOHA_DT_140]
MSTLYEKIGGQPTIEKVVDDFHKRIMTDNTVSGFFAKTDMKKQRDHQIGFFSLILGGPKDYKGRSMDKTHSGMGLQQPHFDAIAKHLSEAMTSSGVSADDAKAAMGEVEKLKPAILNK